MLDMISSREAREVSDAFLTTLYGQVVCERWKRLKEEMKFVLEREFVTWLIDVACQYKQLKSDETISAKDKNDNEQKITLCPEISPTFINEMEDNKPENLVKRETANTDNLTSKEDRCDSECSNVSTVRPTSAASKASSSGSRGSGRKMADVLDKINKRLQGGSALVKVESCPVTGPVDVLSGSQADGSECGSVSTGQLVDKSGSAMCNRPTDCQSPPVNGLEEDEGVRDDYDMYELDCEEIYLSDDGGGDLSDAQNCSPGGSTATNYGGLSPFPPLVAEDLTSATLPLVNPPPLPVTINSPLVGIQQQVISGSGAVTITPAAQSTGPNRCPFYPSCGYSSHGKSNVTRHVRAVHEKLKPWRCPQCDYRSAEKGNMTKHIKKVHRQLKPHTCDYCGYQCAEYSRLTMHIKSVHEGDKPHACPHCKFRSTEKNKVLRHIKVVHLLLDDQEQTLSDPGLDL